MTQAPCASLCGRQAAQSAIDRLSECERERFNSGIEKLDLELALVDRSRLPDQLIQALLGHAAMAVVVDVSAMGRAHRLAIDEHAETHGFAGPRMRWRSRA